MSRREILRRGVTVGVGAVVLSTVGQALVAGPAQAIIQDFWAYCRKCKGLYYRGAGNGVCTASSGGHDPSLSGNYRAEFGITFPEYQQGWMHCRKCQGMAYGNVDPWGLCPAGGRHDHFGTLPYTVRKGLPPPGIPSPFPDAVWQLGWFHCKRCQGLHYGSEQPRSWCPAGGQHSVEGSFIYSLRMA
jgi:hypothetical protein